jgi:hypothetical protein
LSLLLPLGAFAAILAAVTFGGRLVAASFFPPGSTFEPERWSWGFVFGAALLAAQAAVTIALGLSPGWIPTLCLFGIAAALSLRSRLREIGSDTAPQSNRAVLISALLAALLASGVLFYLLRALTEPMWSNDYLAIWGLKGKTLFLAKGFPARVLPPSLYAFSHPEYPLGLPLIYAGAASLLRSWDDHALALLFPFFQVATLGALFGWLRRRRLSWPIPLAAAALLSQLEPLYSGFLTGMAEVPLSCLFLLFGTAYSDCLDETDSGSTRRLAVAAFLSGAIKNEGLFLAAAGAVGALAGRRPARWRTAAACAVPALVVFGLTRVVSSGATTRDFDLAFLGARIGELPARLAESLRVCFAEGIRPAWPILLCLFLLFAAGRSTPFADRLLGLAAACLVVYVTIPALAVLGPTWLARTTLPRTAVALAPLVAAGLAGRFLERSPQP